MVAEGKKVFILAGPAGAGKTTFAEAIIAINSFVLISMGQLVRHFLNTSKSPEAKKAKAMMLKGKLVPNTLSNKLLIKAFLQKAPGFILDGYPRSMPQARFLARLAKKDKWAPITFIRLNISDKDVVKRLSSRVVCPVGDEPYKLPQRICPKHKVKLVRRSDEEPKAIRERLRIYHHGIRPIEAYFAKTGRVISIKITEKKAKDQNVKVVIETLKKNGLL